MRAALFVAALVVGIAPLGADARVHHDYGGEGVPALNVRGSCLDAEKFSTGDDKNVAFKGCMQDETAARDELGKRWSSFKASDRQNCVEQARAPSPSYVEVLTCLEMDSDAMTGPPHDKPTPQIGGPGASVSPGQPLPPPSTPPQ